MNFRRTIILAMFAVGTASIGYAQYSQTGYVYTMTNGAQNTILVGQRSADGRIYPAATPTVSTGGAGTGANLGSSGALALTKDGRWLFAVNAGSNTISVLRQDRTGLKLVTTAPSGGTFPASVAVSGDLIYVLNKGAEGVPANISGFFFDDDRGALFSIANSTRPLSDASPVAAEIGFDNSGSLIFVTERATNLIDSYEIQADGTPDGPHFNTSNGQTPFGFSFDPWNHMIVSEAFETGNPLHPLPNKGAASSYSVNDEGVLATISGSVPTFHTAPCWLVITRNGKFAYTSNTASGVITGYRIHDDGTLSLLNPTGVSATTGGAASLPVDLALSRDGRFLYGVNDGTGTIMAWRVRADGQLTFLQKIEHVPASATGLVAR